MKRNSENVTKEHQINDMFIGNYVCGCVLLSLSVSYIHLCVNCLGSVVMRELDELRSSHIGILFIGAAHEKAAKRRTIYAEQQRNLSVNMCAPLIGHPTANINDDCISPSTKRFCERGGGALPNYGRHSIYVKPKKCVPNFLNNQNRTYFIIN